jgi:hypothetical protein
MKTKTMVENGTMSTDEYRRRVKEAATVGMPAVNASPRVGDWGLFAYSDALPTVGGGAGLFHWFETKAQLLDFVKRHLTFASPGHADIDPGRVAFEAEELVNAMGADPDAEQMEMTRLVLNRALRTFTQIEWWGSLDDLLDGDHPYAKRVRAWFRHAEDETDCHPEQPIAIAELLDFLGSLQNYGF